ncbi:VOC family protein [Rhabdothermincola salaria]|uniref:VOC family protein n=1 Tax=Rhabdothermincola salaria TaxID=2903142 RepID=UPI001E635FEE|nr:VOC family protein [Rhabdothermincola salaria]MCD9625547.1 VOC family protein [Rhabdothermincola salaria]
MNAPVTGFSHVQLRVGDLERSRRWYETVLGMEAFVELPDTVALRNREARLVVVLSPAERLEAASSPLDHIAFGAPDGESLEVWARHLSEAGIAHEGVVLELGKPSLQLLDPDGNAVELVAPAPR